MEVPGIRLSGPERQNTRYALTTGRHCPSRTGEQIDGGGAGQDVAWLRHRTWCPLGSAPVAGDSDSSYLSSKPAPLPGEVVVGDVVEGPAPAPYIVRVETSPSIARSRALLLHLWRNERAMKRRRYQIVWLVVAGIGLFDCFTSAPWKHPLEWGWLAFAAVYALLAWNPAAARISAAYSRLFAVPTTAIIDDQGLTVTARKARTIPWADLAVVETPECRLLGRKRTWLHLDDADLTPVQLDDIRARYKASHPLS